MRISFYGRKTWKGTTGIEFNSTTDRVLEIATCLYLWFGAQKDLNCQAVWPGKEIPLTYEKFTRRNQPKPCEQDQNQRQQQSPLQRSQRFRNQKHWTHQKLPITKANVPWSHLKNQAQVNPTLVQ